LTGCSSNNSKEVNTTEVQESTATALEEQLGYAPDVKCLNALPLKVEATTKCIVTATNGRKYDTTVTLTHIDEKGNFSFDIDVADKPN